MASIEDIRAASYDVCGVVRMVSAGYKAKVTSNFYVYLSFAPVYKYCKFYIKMMLQYST